MDNVNIQYDLLDVMVKEGLYSFGCKMQGELGHAWRLVDEQGMEFYPYDHEQVTEELSEFLADLPAFTENEYYYSKNQKRLVMKVSSVEPARSVYVIIEDICKEDIMSASETVKPYRLALQYFIRFESRIMERFYKRRKHFLAEMLLRGSVRMEKLMEDLGESFDSHMTYVVMLVELSDRSKLLSEEELRSFCEDFSAGGKAKAYPLLWQDMYLLVLGGAYDQYTFELLEGWPQRYHLQQWQEVYEKRYGVEVGIGVGNPYPVTKLHMSYNEARIALKFHSIKGDKHFVQRFEDLGIFKVLFQTHAKETMEFCRSTLDKLLEYDHDYDANLRETLMSLLYTGLNYKLTAERMHVHVNTVRYRCEKIEQLLDIKLSDVDQRLNLYVALRVGDVLQALDVMKPGYVGKLLDGRSNADRKVQ